MLRTNNLKRLSAVALIAISLSACQNAQNAPKQAMGTLMGDGVGALLGAQMGSGKGKLASVVIGTLGGAYLGSEIGKSLDSADRMYMEKNAQSTLEYSQAGTAFIVEKPRQRTFGHVQANTHIHSNIRAQLPRIRIHNIHRWTRKSGNGFGLQAA